MNLLGRLSDTERRRRDRGFRADERQVLKLRDRGQLLTRLHDERLTIFGDVARGQQVAVLCQCILDVLNSEALVAELRVVRRDRHALADVSQEVGLAHPIDGLDVIDGRLVQRIAEGVRAQRAGHGEREDGNVVETLGHDLGGDAGWERQPVDRQLHLLLGRGDIRAVLEGGGNGG